MSSVTYSQAAIPLNLAVMRGDPVSLRWLIDQDYGGTYTAQIRTQRDHTSTLVGTLTVAANVLDSGEAAAYVADGVEAAVGDTEFTLTMSAVAAADIVVGDYWWDMQESGGVTRFAGRYTVQRDVTA